MAARNQQCDSCGGTSTRPGTIRRLSLPGNAGLYLCRRCWAKEMSWRKQRNKNLHPSAKFPIRKFPG